MTLNTTTSNVDGFLWSISAVPSFLARSRHLCEICDRVQPNRSVLQWK
jgi:hypothetical protein